jgi:hypothetical protein
MWFQWEIKNIIRCPPSQPNKHKQYTCLLLSTASHAGRTQKVDSADRATTNMASRAGLRPLLHPPASRFVLGRSSVPRRERPAGAGVVRAVSLPVFLSLRGHCWRQAARADGRGTRCVPCRQPSPLPHSRQPETRPGQGALPWLAAAGRPGTQTQRKNQMELHLRM